MDKTHSRALDFFLSFLFINAIAAVSFLLWIYVSQSLSVLLTIFAGVGAAAFFMERTTRLMLVVIPVYLVAGLGGYLASEYWAVAKNESVGDISILKIHDHLDAGSFTFVDGELRPEYGYCTVSKTYVEHGNPKKSVPTCTIPYVHKTWTRDKPVQVWVVHRMADADFSFENMKTRNTRLMVRETHGGPIPGVAHSAIKRHNLIVPKNNSFICAKMVDSIEGEKQELKLYVIGLVGGVEFLWLIFALVAVFSFSKPQKNSL